MRRLIRPKVDDKPIDIASESYVITDRQLSITNWLKRSKFAHWFSIGFHVYKGEFGTLKSGKQVEILDWLFEEGIRAGLSIAGYDTIHSPAEMNYPSIERLTFFGEPMEYDEGSYREHNRYPDVINLDEEDEDDLDVYPGDPDDKWMVTELYRGITYDPEDDSG